MRQLENYHFDLIRMPNISTVVVVFRMTDMLHVITVSHASTPIRCIFALAQNRFRSTQMQRILLYVSRALKLQAIRGFD